MSQALDLQARLEADRVAIREREAALAQAEDARQALQEQLRRRAEELATRSKALDDLARQLAADRGIVDHARTAADALAIRPRSASPRHGPRSRPRPRKCSDKQPRSPSAKPRSAGRWRD